MGCARCPPQASIGLRAGRAEWIGLAVLALPTLLVSIDIYVMLLALPHVSMALGATSTQQLWITDVYGFPLAGFLVTMGTLGDRIGRRKVLLCGAAAFCVASVLSAYSRNPDMLIAAPALLGLAAATLAPSTLSLIRTMFRDPGQMGVAIGIWGMCFSAGAIIGPLLGGIMLERFWWGSVFLISVPAMVLLLVLGPWLLPEYRAPAAGRVDLVSVGVFLAAVFGLTMLARDGWQTIPVLAIAAGLVFAVVFVHRQNRIPAPLLDLRLFTNRTFSAADLIGGGVGMPIPVCSSLAWVAAGVGRDRGRGCAPVLSGGRRALRRGRLSPRASGCAAFSWSAAGV